MPIFHFFTDFFPSSPADILTFPPTYVTWSRGMSRMSLMLILSYRLKQMTHSYVLQCFEIDKIAHVSWTRCRIVMGYGSKCRIWYVQEGYIENSKIEYYRQVTHFPWSCHIFERTPVFFFNCGSIFAERYRIINTVDVFNADKMRPSLICTFFHHFIFRMED